MKEVFEKIDNIFAKYRKKWLEQPNTEPCKGLKCISNDCVDCMLTHLENDINQVAEEYQECALCYFGNPCEYQNKDARMPESELNNGWIPCSERLPEEEYDTVLTVTDRNHCCVAVYTTEHGFRTMDIDCEGDFIAWQPLPEPYKPGGE